MTNIHEEITQDNAMQNCPECGDKLTADGTCLNVSECGEAQDTASRTASGSAMSAPMAFTISGNVD